MNVWMYVLVNGIVRNQICKLLNQWETRKSKWKPPNLKEGSGKNKSKN